MDKILIESKSPLVSVIMPVYNAQLYIQDAIKSIINQTYTNFELIIIDDGSTDNTISEIAKFTDNRIILIRNERNQGIVYSLNTAISKSNGTFIARMDADDISHKERLNMQVIEFKKNNRLILCGTWYSIFYKNITIRKVQLPSNNSELKLQLNFKNVICHPSCMFKKTLWQQFNGYKETDVNCEDYGLWLLGINEGDYYNIPHYLLKYRIHDTNVSISKKEFTKNAVFLIIKNNLLFKFNINFFPNDYKQTIKSYIHFIKKDTYLSHRELYLFQNYFLIFFNQHYGYMITILSLFKFDFKIIILNLYLILVTKMQNLIYNFKIITIDFIIK